MIHATGAGGSVYELFMDDTLGILTGIMCIHIRAEVFLLVLSIPHTSAAKSSRVPVFWSQAR